MRAARTALAVALAFAGGAASAAPPAGETVFQQRCGTCHALDAGAPKMGPPLRGIVGRKAAAQAGYTYSGALTKARLTWTRPELDRFLAAPGKAVPGTKMLVGVSDAQQRAAVVAYLASLTPAKTAARR